MNTEQPLEAKEHSAEPRNWHYSEPWSTQWSPEGTDIISSEGKVAQTYQKYPKQMEDANARRIVACVNACNGLSNEALESLNFKQYNENCRNIYESLQSQLADLKRIIQNDAEAIDHMAAAVKERDETVLQLKAQNAELKAEITDREKIQQEQLQIIVNQHDRIEKQHSENSKNKVL